MLLTSRQRGHNRVDLKGEGHVQTLIPDNVDDVVDEQDDNGHMRMWTKGHVGVIQVHGHLTTALAQQQALWLQRRAQSVLDGGAKIQLFQQWWAMTGYDSKSRSLLTQVMVPIIKHYEEITFLLQSRIVQMGVAVANVALEARLQSMTDAAAYQAKFALAASKVGLDDVQVVALD